MGVEPHVWLLWHVPDDEDEDGTLMSVFASVESAKRWAVTVGHRAVNAVNGLEWTESEDGEIQGRSPWRGHAMLMFRVTKMEVLR